MKPIVIKCNDFNSLDISTSHLPILLPNIEVFYFINENKVILIVIIKLSIT